MATDCAVCYGSFTDLDPATTGEPCNCSGTIKYHPFCYEDMCSKLAKCPVCKATINKTKIFDNSWIVQKCYNGTLYYTIDSERKHHGKYVIINDARKIKEQCNYVHGLKDGLYQKFGEKSKLIHEANYKMGKLHGRYYGEKHHLYNEYIYSMNYEDGLLNGPAEISRKKSLWETPEQTNTVFGKITGHFKNGMMHGTFKIFDMQGAILESINYKDGELHGCAIYYSYDGSKTIEQKTEFKNGSICGKLTVYWPHTGTERFTCIMNNDGMVIGPVYINDESGGLVKKIMCKKPAYLADVLPEGINIRKPNESSDMCIVYKEYYGLREFDHAYWYDYEDYSSFIFRTYRYSQYKCECCNDDYEDYEDYEDYDNYWDDDDRYERLDERYERRAERYEYRRYYRY